MFLYMYLSQSGVTVRKIFTFVSYMGCWPSPAPAHGSEAGVGGCTRIGEIGDSVNIHKNGKGAGVFGSHSSFFLDTMQSSAHRHSRGHAVPFHVADGASDRCAA